MFIVFKLIKKMQKKMYRIINMNYLLIATVLVLISLLILGITFYFGNPKDNVDIVENVENVDIADIDIDPLGDIEADENPEPVKNNIAVSGEPDINMEPEVISVPVNPPNKPEENVTSSPTPTTTPAKPLVPVIKKSAVPPPSASSTTTDEDVPVQPTPTTTPAQPLVPVIKKRMLTAQELHAFYDIVVREVRKGEDGRHPSANARQDRENNCYANAIAELAIAEISNFKFSEDKIKNLIETGNLRENVDEYQNQRLMQILSREAFERLRQQCGLEAQIVPRDVPHNAGSAGRPYPENSMIIGKRGKFAKEGGFDVNNKTDILSFPPARSVDLHIEHVDVHRGEPQNKNAYILFKYKFKSHKFTFVGNGGLRFRKQDGSFGPNLGVGDASKTVLRDMGLPTNSYQIECLRTAGRNTWHFKPLDLSGGLVGIELSDNADWGGLRGVYLNVQSESQPRTPETPVVLEPLVKKYGRACVAPNIIKQWSVKGTGVKAPTREMTNYCNNNSACVFIWAEDDRSSFYACNGNGSFKYNRDNWVKTKR